MPYDGEERRTPKPADSLTEHEVHGIREMLTDYKWWLTLGKKLKNIVAGIIAIPAVMFGIEYLQGLFK